MATAASPMTAHQFDDRSIQWRELEGFKHMLVSIFFVDAARHRVDFLIKFDPHEKVLLHQHLADTNTFVVEGDHVIYEPDGSVRETRPVGQYTFGTGRDAHDEGGGPNGCVAALSKNLRMTSELTLMLVSDRSRNFSGLYPFSKNISKMSLPL